jgi:hypothetical protein
VLARLKFLEHDLLRTETHLSDLLLDTLELGWQREHHDDVHADWWRRPVLDQWRLVVIQQVYVIVRDRGCRDIGLLLYRSLLLCWEHRPNSVEMLISFLLGRILPQLLCSHLDPPPLAVRESWRTPMRCWSRPRCCYPRGFLLAGGYRNWMVRFGKLDCSVLRLLRTGLGLCLGLCLCSWNLALLRCGLLWIFLYVRLHFVIDQSLAPRPCLPLNVSLLINRRPIGCLLLLLRLGPAAAASWETRWFSLAFWTV